VRRKHECVPLASRRCKEGLHDFWSIGYEIFEFAVDGVYREDGIFADVGVTMFHEGVADQDQRFEKLGVLTEGCAANIFVWILLEITIIRLGQVPQTTRLLNEFSISSINHW
jgi:hypothetical protein